MSFAKRTGFSLASEISVMFVLLGVVPLFLIGLQYFSAAEKQLRQEIAGTLSAVADAKVGRIEGFARDRLRDALTLSSLPLTVNSFDALSGSGPTAEIETQLRQVAETMGAGDLMLVDARGTILFAAESHDAVGLNVEDRSVVLTNLVDRARTLLEAQVSDYAQIGSPRHGAAFAAAPVLDRGRVIGVVLYRIDQTEVFRIVGDHNGLGETGEALVGGPWGESVMLHGPVRFEDALEDRLFSTGDPAGEPFRLALSGERGVDLFRDYRGQEVLAAWRYLPSFRWALVVKADTEERLEPIRDLRNMGLLVLGVAGVLIIVVSALMARAITTPISELQKAAENFSEERADEMMPVTGAWEINALARSFNRMARRIHAYQSGLRRMVEDRTAELRQAKEEAEAATRAKTEFLAVVSHELRTPLNGVLGVAELLKTRKLDDTSRTHVDTILRSGGALAELVNDILDISRIEAGRLTIETRAFDPRAVVQELEALLRRAAEVKGLPLVLEIDPTVPTLVEGDPSRLRQVLLNLLGNAVKFTDAGRVTLGMQTGLGSDRIDFIVADTGIGIPVDAHAALFQPFSQLSAERSARYGGVGLGLAISKRLVEAMGGDIMYESAEGKGTRFTVRLRLPVAEPALEEKLPPRDMRLPPLSLLVVEDDAVSRMVLEGLLSRDGHAVTAVADAEAAYALLANGINELDMVLTDLRLPGADGTSVAERAKPLPVIAVTANLMPEDRAACARVGIRAVVGKPIGTEPLREALRIAFLDGEGMPELEAAADTTKILDETYLHQLQEGLPPQEVARLIELARSAVVDRAGEAVRGDADAAHRLAGAAGGYGLLALREAAKTMEAEIRTNGSSQLDLASQVEAALDALEAWQLREEPSAEPVAVAADGLD